MKEGDYIAVYDNRKLDFDKDNEPIAEGTVVKVQSTQNGTKLVYLTTGYTVEISEL